MPLARVKMKIKIDMNKKGKPQNSPKSPWQNIRPIPGLQEKPVIITNILIKIYISPLFFSFMIK